MLNKYTHCCYNVIYSILKSSISFKYFLYLVLGKFILVTSKTMGISFKDTQFHGLIFFNLARNFGFGFNFCPSDSVYEYTFIPPSNLMPIHTNVSYTIITVPTYSL